MIFGEVRGSAVDKLNSRIEKILKFQVCYGVFEKLTGLDAGKITGYEKA